MQGLGLQQVVCRSSYHAAPQANADEWVADLNLMLGTPAFYAQARNACGLLISVCVTGL